MKLIFLDVDGTLTWGGSEVPPASAVEAIRKARKAGNQVFLCTGRNQFLLENLSKIGFDGIIGSAGSFIRIQNEVIFDLPLRKEQVDLALRVMHEQGVYCMLEAQEANYGDLDLGNLLEGTSGGNSELQRVRNGFLQRGFMKSMDEWPGTPIYKIVCMYTDHAQLDAVVPDLAQDFEVVTQSVRKEKGVHNVELVNRKFNKGDAVKLVMQRLGVQKEDTYGFGDSMNDLPMLQSVGTGVCMANGSEELKKISDIVIPSVNQDGLYKGFEMLNLF